MEGEKGSGFQYPTIIQVEKRKKKIVKNTREGVGRLVPQPSSKVDKHKLDTEGGVCCLTSYSNNTPADTTSKELRAIRCFFFFFLNAANMAWYRYQCQIRY